MKAHSLFINNIWGTDLADIQLISKCDRGFTITNAFPKKFEMSQNANQIKYGQTKEVNFMIDQ